LKIKKSVIGYAIAFLAGTVLSGTSVFAATQYVKALRGTSQVPVNGKIIEKTTKLTYNGSSYEPIHAIQAGLNKAGIHNAWNGTTLSMTSPSSPATLDKHIVVKVHNATTPGSATITYSGVPSHYALVGAYYDNLTASYNNSCGIQYFTINFATYPHDDLPSLSFFIPMADINSKAKFILVFANGKGHILIAESPTFTTHSY
jgi:hypothetical protein